MRKRFDPQIQLGQTPVEHIVLPTKSRDELPPVLAGLQWIYKTPAVNEEVFALLEAHISVGKANTGRPGMELWQILVLGVVRLALNCDYDRMEHIANFDGLVRQMLGVPAYDRDITFHHRTISDNICHVDEELLKKINEVVVRHGHDIFKKNGKEKLQVKTDSFVLETNIHYPSDLNLLWDALRKSIELSTRQAEARGLKGWRKSTDWLRRAKNTYRACTQAGKGGGVNRAERVGKAVTAYLSLAHEIENKVKQTLSELSQMPTSVLQAIQTEEIRKYYNHVVKHMDLVERRLLKGERIPHEEKIFSLFEEHSEMIIKGKINPPAEFGHRVMISSDQFGLIVDYKVMSGGDEKAEVQPLVLRLHKQFGKDSIRSLSTDKGFSSKENRKALEGLMDYVVLPKVGKLSLADIERESESKWRGLKHAHSAVESDINSLEHHGLDRCPDKGENGFHRYSGLGVLALNLHRIGKRLQSRQNEQKRRRRRKAA